MLLVSTGGMIRSSNCDGLSQMPHTHDGSLYSIFQLLTKAMKEFDHDIPNFDLHSMSTVDEVVKFFQTEVRDSTKLEDLSKLDLPKNLHMNLEPIRFDPETDTVHGGKTAFPGNHTIVSSIKYKRKYKGYEGKVRWK